MFWLYLYMAGYLLALFLFVVREKLLYKGHVTVGDLFGFVTISLGSWIVVVPLVCFSVQDIYMSSEPWVRNILDRRLF